ncbi:cold-shock protein [Poseidonocella sedimentorum]|uniref:Cold-shock DNA-binding protein family n=1 Tax=Poseidonocella sedimentorum TaxID=871652 RepID=A0A1I6DFN7_9RHOB|nr:cold shock domain-containing protein [Poseidonocella sedimentorum]SFR04132.1 cold-shock DNA-binding protein family [Poseidonocella sedimentorum]
MKQEQITSVVGRVKWFDPSKGYGFIVADTISSDILLHANVLRNFGQGSVADGSGIEVVTQSTDRGVQAIQVLRIDPPDGTGLAGLADLEGFDEERLDAAELEPARVKWFDKAKGFGFANTFGRSEDIFIHVEVLRASGLADLQPGEAVCLKAIDGQRGRMAVQISAWESAFRDE